ncbi:MAG TPA: hypothetical protein DDX92_03615 [Flavobacteriales bacterium]|nr:hypothetical protein [Flavobacteriales bacterium]
MKTAPYSQRTAQLKSVKLKVLGDFYFDQKDYNGDQISQYQVFTYELFNAENQENLVNDIEYSTEPVDISSMPYYPGTVRLGKMSNIPDNAKTIIGNELYIRAERIELDKNAATGYAVTHLEAVDRVVLLRDEGAHLDSQWGAEWRFRTRDDWFGRPVITEASKDYVRSFCTEGKYKANIIPSKRKIDPSNPEDIVLSEISSDGIMFSVFPNPTYGRTTVRWSSSEINDQSVWVSVVDISGTEVVSRKVSVTDELMQFDLSDLSNGVYMVQLKTESGYTGIRKLVKQ